MGSNWRTALDPALRGHARRVTTALRRADAEMRQATATAMAEYLRTATAAVLGPSYRVPPALVAAADDTTGGPPPDLDAWPPAEYWRGLIDAHISPAGGKIFGQAFAAQARNSPVSAERAVLSYMDNTTDRLSRDLWPDGVFEEVRYEMLVGLSQGESIDQLRDRIGAVTHIDAYTRRIRAEINALRASDDPAAAVKLRRLYREVDAADAVWHNQARRVARTESIAALNGGQHAGAAARAQSTGEEMFKQWLATEDSRTRPDHVAADGQTVALHAPFVVGGWPMQFPGEAGAPAGQVCNCRCVTLYLDKGEVSATTVV